MKAAIQGSPEVGAQASLLAHEFYGGDSEAALDGLRMLLREHPDAEQPVEQFLWSLFGGRHRGLVGDEVIQDEGLPLAEQRIERAPESVFAYWMKQQLLSAQVDWEGLLEETTRGLAVFPDEETMMLMRAQALVELDELEEAAHWYARAIGAKPSFVGARIGLGRLYERLGQHELAEKVFREIPTANEEFVFGSVSVALFLARREAWDEAEQVFVDTWRRLPEDLRAAVLRNPEAAVLLEREAVQAVLEETG